MAEELLDTLGAALTLQRLTLSKEQQELPLPVGSTSTYEPPTIFPARCLVQKETKTKPEKRQALERFSGPHS